MSTEIQVVSYENVDRAPGELDEGVQPQDKYKDGEIGREVVADSWVASQGQRVPIQDAVEPSPATVASGEADAAPCAPGADASDPWPRLTQKGRGRKLGSKGKHPHYYYGGIRGQKLRLQGLAKKLANEPSDGIRKEIRRSLEVISLLYAAASRDSEGFMKSCQLAVDLSGYKLEQREKIKEKAKQKQAGEKKRARVRMVDMGGDGSDRKEEAF